MIKGTGKAKREAAALFMNVGTEAAKVFELLGRGAAEMSRTFNNTITSAKDVTGLNDTIITAGAQVTTIDPVKFENDSKVSAILYDIYKYGKELSDVEHEFVEVFMSDEQGENEYGAFLQVGAIDLKSWGGDTTGVNTPFDIDWKGERVQGTFNPVTKVFTPAGASKMQLCTFSVSGPSNARVEGASIEVGGKVIVTDATGIAAIQLPAGAQAYTVRKEGMADKSGSITVADAAMFEAVTMTAAV